MTSSTTESSTVLVTGGSGYVGGWAVAELLNRGYRVRTTIRNLAREAEVRAAVAEAADPRDRLTVVAADLLQDSGWDEATAGADFVLHVASPMPTGEYRGLNVIKPAREGTRRVLEASLKAGVKRVVITSSTGAAIPPRGADVVADEHIWTDLPDKPVNNYFRSKTLAEQDAWAFAKANPAMELATILPSQILGPVLGVDYGASAGIIALMLKGKMPAVPRIGNSIVDVRDLIDLHIRAMVDPAAAGERFVAAGEFVWFLDMARLLRDELGAQAAQAPKGLIPDWVIRLGALFNPEMAFLAPNLGVETKITSAKAERVLGWRPRSAKVSILDTAKSLVQRGLV